MGKLKIIFIFVFILTFSQKITAIENINFGWSLGNIWVYHTILQNDQYTTSVGGFDILHFNWLLYNRLILGINLFTSHGSPGNNSFTLALLPIEVGFIPLSFNISRNHQLNFSVNGKVGWLYENYRNNDRFYASLGGRIFLQFRHPDTRRPYSRYLSLFAEYNTFREWRIGVGIDLTMVVFGLLMLDFGREPVDRPPHKSRF